ncbi:MAG: hypothetical protein H0Z24_05535 [Thermosipho sp. (in: Bacteria)]|nr:hypothetical protein [Thermosipho sp. (in: thermotogales)]
MSNKKDNKKILSIINEINKKFGTNAVQVGSEIVTSKVERIPTGSISLDIALGGGIPVGRFTEISGALSSTKTTQVAHIVANAQKQGLVCLWADAEGTTDKEYLEYLGVNIDELIYTRPDGLEECTQMILDMQRSGLVNVAVIDSIEALSPIKEQESEMEDSVQMGIKPKLLAEFFRKYQAGNNRLVREGKKPFTIIGINQLRERMSAYGDPEFSPGGRAKGFTASVELRLRRGDWITQGSNSNKEIVGQVVKFKINKNKTFKPMQTGEFDFYFAENKAGIKPLYNDNFKSIIIESIAWGLIDRAGAWYYLDKGTENEKKFQGTDKLIEYFRENPQLIEEYRNKIIELALSTK